MFSAQGNVTSGELRKGKGGEGGGGGGARGTGYGPGKEVRFRDASRMVHGLLQTTTHWASDILNAAWWIAWCFSSAFALPHQRNMGSRTRWEAR